MIRYVRHAWARTVANFGGKSALIIAITSPIVALVLQHIWIGPEDTISEIEKLAITGVATAGVFFSLFLFHLAAAPVRIARIELHQEIMNHAKTKRALAIYTDSHGITDFVSSADRFSLRELACLLARQPYRTGELHGAAAHRLEELYERVLAGRSLPIGGVHAAQLEFLRQKHRMGIAAVTSEDRELLARVWITRAGAKSYAESLSVSVPGLTDSDR